VVQSKRESSFQKNITWQYGKRISTAKHPLIPTQRLKQAALSEVYQWIVWAWITFYIRFDLQELQSDGNFKCMDMTHD
jgi:hypothetical protein